MTSLPSRNLLLRAFGPDLEIIREHLFPVALSAGQVLNEPGDEIRQVYFLTSGLVSKCAVFASGHQIECALIGRTGATGALAAIGFGRSLTRDVAILDTHAWAIPVSRLQAACSRSDLIRRRLTEHCEAQMAYAVRAGACNALHSVEQRLSRWLLTCADLLGGRDIRLAQEAFASVLGVQRTSINPVLQRFQLDGLVTLARSRLSLVDVAGLRSRSCECYAAVRPLTGAEPCPQDAAE